ncbi:MAG: bifunctional adenosylcobinamide kinase/adenosylcobinamide-phosphate guanylyltransferase [Acidimicrobiales bacterium]
MIVLVLGGSRSGKSAVAEEIAARHAPVTYLATILPDDDDADLSARLDAHRVRRPSDWDTVEPPYDLGDVLEQIPGTILLDSLGPWVAGSSGPVDIGGLVGALRRRHAPTVVVSDEVGLGVHPETELGRRFRDELGRVNQAVASVADQCLFVVAGRVLPLERP